MLSAASRAARLSTTVWSVLLMGLALSLLAFYAAKSVVEREAKLKLDKSVEDATGSFDKRIRSNIGVLYGVQGLFMATDSVTRLPRASADEQPRAAREEPNIKNRP